LGGPSQSRVGGQISAFDQWLVSNVISTWERFCHSVSNFVTIPWTWGGFISVGWVSTFEQYTSWYWCGIKKKIAYWLSIVVGF